MNEVLKVVARRIIPRNIRFIKESILPITDDKDGWFVRIKELEEKLAVCDER